MERPKGFMCYLDMRNTLHKLPPEEVGLLMLAMYDYAAGEKPGPLPERCDLVFDMLCRQIDRDFAKYAATREKRAAAGRKGAAVTNRREPEDMVERIFAEAGYSVPGRDSI